MTRTAKSLLTALALLLCAPATLAQGDDIHHLLARMAEAVRTLSYDGTFVFLHENQLETMRVVHTLREGGERERLISLNGAAREVVRDNASVTCIAPDARSVSVANRMIAHGLRAVFSLDTRKLTGHYTFREIGHDRVANRATRVVAIIPQDGYRYGYRIHLDTESALPLKTDMLDEKGVPVSQVMFTSLRIADDIDDLAEHSMDGRELYKWVQSDVRKPRQSTDGSGWRFGWLPAGFSMSMHSERAPGPGAPKLDHYVLSDGLATLSVYIEAQAQEGGLSGHSRMGAVNAFGSQIDGYQVTAVGEVPELTVERVAAGITAADD
ncbi:MAG: MucB/RseB C-terminal domain-containing protein [Candidatus Sedimenticola endophacoides]